MINNNQITWARDLLDVGVNPREGITNVKVSIITMEPAFEEVGDGDVPLINIHC